MSLSLFLAAAAAGSATPVLPPRATDDLAVRLLAVHNQARAEVGAPPLTWDESLARSAASYGPRLAAIGRLVHSPRGERPGQRENLAMDLDWRGTPESLAAMWVDEKKWFVPGQFPAVTRTGRWEDVAHYTQMIWKGTTHVGCALHDEKGWRYLICRYSPPGNKDGAVVP
jgi:hypothetical protein